MTSRSKLVVGIVVAVLVIGGARSASRSRRVATTRRSRWRPPNRRCPRPRAHDRRAATRRQCRSRRSPGSPTRAGKPDAARAVGEGREHSRRAAAGRHRPGRRRVRGRGRGQHHALPRHLQLGDPGDDRTGPLGALQDPDIVWPIHGIFAYSGGAADPVAAINAAPVHAVDNSAAVANGVNGMERDAPASRRRRPHNLYGMAPLVRARRRPGAAAAAVRLPVAGVPPPPDADLGAPVISTRIGFLAGYDPTYTWDAASGTWKRSHSRPTARRGRRRPDRAGERGRAVHPVRGRVQRPDRRRGRRVGVLRRPAPGTLDPARPRAARAVRRRERTPDPPAPGQDLGRAAAGGYAVDVEFAPLPAHHRATRRPPPCADRGAGDDTTSKPTKRK